MTVVQLKRKPNCSHMNVIVNLKTRSVRCQKCRAPLDPLDALVTLLRQRSWDARAGKKG